MDASTRLRLFRSLRAENWVVRKVGGHWKIWNPAGRLITTTPGTPSDVYGPKKLVRDLQRAGFPGWLPTKQKRKRSTRKVVTPGDGHDQS